MARTQADRAALRQLLANPMTFKRDQLYTTVYTSEISLGGAALQPQTKAGTKTHEKKVRAIKTATRHREPQ